MRLLIKNGTVVTAADTTRADVWIDGDKIGPLENLSEDLTLAARHALLQMIEYLKREHGLTAEQAYTLSSVAVDLRVGQVVDVPNYIVTAVLNMDVFAD